MSLDSLRAKMKQAANDNEKFEHKREEAISEEQKIRDQIAELQRQADKVVKDRQAAEAEMAKITPKIHQIENEISQEERKVANDNQPGQRHAA